VISQASREAGLIMLFEDIDTKDVLSVLAFMYVVVNLSHKVFNNTVYIKN